MKEGIFISFEGNEGCGKSTQIRRLQERLEENGVSPLLTREPGGTEIGEQIRHLLQYAPSGKAMAPETELLLFAASRAQLVRELIQPALASGRVVVADRFLDSTTVYQGVARKLEADQVALINHFAVGEMLPSVTILLDIEVREARQRMKQRPSAAVEDRMEQEPVEFYEAVRKGYLAVAELEPERFLVVSAARSEAEVADEIWQNLKERFHGFLS